MSPLPPDMSAPPLDSCGLATYHSIERAFDPKSSSILRLADTILEPDLGTAKCPTVGSVNHRLGTCKPCAFLHKQGCSNGVDCPFCHLCDAGEKKRRQKAKKMQLQSMKPLTPGVHTSAAPDDVPAPCWMP